MKTFLLAILFVFPAMLKAETYYMSILGGGGQTPLPVLTVSCPNSGVVTVNAFLFTDGKGVVEQGSYEAKVIRDDQELAIFEATDENLSLRIEVDRKKSFTTAPFNYRAFVTLKGAQLTIAPDQYMSTRQLNPAYPEVKGAVGAVLQSKIPGDLVECLHRKRQ